LGLRGRSETCPLVRSPEVRGLQAARDTGIREGLDTDYELYRVTGRKHGPALYALTKMMNWSSGKVYGSVRRLEGDGWVCTEKAERDDRNVLKVGPVEECV